MYSEDKFSNLSEYLRYAILGDVFILKYRVQDVTISVSHSVFKQLRCESISMQYPMLVFRNKDKHDAVMLFCGYVIGCDPTLPDDNVILNYDNKDHIVKINYSTTGVCYPRKTIKKKHSSIGITL